MLHHFSNLYSCVLLHCSTAQTTTTLSSVEWNPRPNGPSAQPCTKVTTHCFAQHRNPWCALQICEKIRPPNTTGSCEYSGHGVVNSRQPSCFGG